MEIVIRFIGIILFVSNTSTGKQTYDVYLPDLTKETEILRCKDKDGKHPKAPPHTAAIRIRSDLGKQKYWGSHACNDGVGCQLFIFPPGNKVQITAVTDQGGEVTGTLKYLKHLQDDNYFAKIIDATPRIDTSAAFLHIDTGTIESDEFSNKQGYATLYVRLKDPTELTITAGPNSLKIPKADRVSFDIVNIPSDQDTETSGIPKTGGHNDFLAYYLYSYQDEVCTTPTNSMPQRVTIPMATKTLTNATAKMQRMLLDDDVTMSPIGGNADCSSSTWP